MLRRGRPGLLGTVARTAVVAGTATATVNAVNRRGQERAVEAEQAAAYRTQQQAPPPPAAPQAAAPPPSAPQPSSGGSDLVSQLTDLARLRDAGVLSPAEFDAAKARLLAP
jgi:Short C-terminal domain